LAKYQLGTYVAAHKGVSVEWSTYRNPLPENVYLLYMQYWKDTEFEI